MLQVIDYTERSVAVIGTSKDNKQMIADMKAMRGSYNRGLTCGAGWIFSKAKHGEQVKDYVAKWNAAHPADAQPQTPAPPKPQPTPAPQSSPEPTPQAVEQPAPATISIPIIEDELEGAPF